MLKLGETSCSDVVHEGALAGCFCLCSNAGSANLMECAILGELEREEADFIVSADQVRSQFAAEEFGITARY